MSVPTHLFEIDTYLAPEEHFHFARKQLSRDPPPVQHHHDYYELFMIEDGRCLHLINETEEALEIGDMVFIRPDDTHAFQADRNTGCRILNVMFRTSTADHLSQRYATEFRDRFFWVRDGMPAKIGLIAAQRERAVNSMLALQNSNRSLAQIEWFLLSIMTHTLNDIAMINHRAPLWLVKACRDAQRPDVFRDGAAGLVAAAARTHEHVARCTRKYLGMSPTAYVNRIRMQHAAMMLGRTDLPVFDLAQECGVTNLSHFHRLFKQHYGTTPADYRRRRQSSGV